MKATILFSVQLALTIMLFALLSCVPFSDRFLTLPFSDSRFLTYSLQKAILPASVTCQLVSTSTTFASRRQILQFLGSIVHTSFHFATMEIQMA